MFKDFIFFILVFFSFSLMVYISPSAWFVYFPKEYLYFLSLFCVFLQLFIYWYDNKKKEVIFFLNTNYIWTTVLFGISIFLMIFFPVRNLNLGDGVLLLEHLALEAKIFGFHLTMDEILEALIHSLLYAKFDSFFLNPMQVYRLVSTVSGIIAISILFYFLRKFEVKFIGYFLVLSSGGMYLFSGYSENYTLITTGLWFYILFVIREIKENKKRNLKILIPISLIASLLILFHLVSGYLLLSLVFLCYHFSDEGKFIRNAFFCTLVSILFLAPVFLYFTFLSEVRFDFTQTHLTNPKFYPLKKIISINHFRDILFCIIGSTFLPFVILIYYISFRRLELKNIFKKKEIQFLMTVLTGFSIHGFVHYPQLGFPADWDLLTFYWTPISFLCVFVWIEMNQSNEVTDDIPMETLPLKFVPIFLFAGFVFILNGIYLSIPDKSKLDELDKSLTRINKFSNSEEPNKIKIINPAYKKFYLSVAFFLFESGEKLSVLDSTEESLRLRGENENFKLELARKIDSVEPIWQKDFYARMTKYHLEYLKLMQHK